MSDGTIEQTDQRVTFRYERRLRHSIDVMWKALTEPAEIEGWTGSRPEIDLQPGGQYVTHHRGGHRVVDRIVRLDPPRLFEHTFWEQVNPSAVVTWELSPIDAGGCLLVLTHSLSMEDVHAAAATVAPKDHPAVILARNAAGWHRLLDRLEETLDGCTAEWSKGAQQALQERYAAQLA